MGQFLSSRRESDNLVFVNALKNACQSACSWGPAKYVQMRDATAIGFANHEAGDSGGQDKAIKV